MTARLRKGAMALVILALLVATPATAVVAPTQDEKADNASSATTWLPQLVWLANHLTAWWPRRGKEASKGSRKKLDEVLDQSNGVAGCSAPASSNSGYGGGIGPIG